MKRILVIAGALALLVPFAVAHAAPVQQFSFQVTNVHPDGRFTLLFRSHIFDTTGGVPPELRENWLRAPAGATLRKEFLNKRFFCDGPALRDALDNHPVPPRIHFADRVANLKPFIRTLAKSRKRSDRKALANARVCERARIGSGTAKIDARASIPQLVDLIPSKFSMFFSRASVKNGVAGFTVIGAADERSPVVKRTPVVAGVHVALTASFINDPTPDGLYGYKLFLPVGPVNGFHVSIAELAVKTTGLSIPKGTCLKESRRGRCVKRQKKTLFWFTRPKCPASGQLNFEAFYGYDPPQPDVTQTVTLPCPKFG